LATHNNGVDLNDFYALAGADGTRKIQQVIVVAMADGTGRLNEHSLLASGQFDPARIFRSVMNNGAAASEYAGIRVLVVQPLARERATFHDVRWLAALDSDVLLFGTPASIRQEIDRFVAHSAPDAFLLRKLARMHSDDATWTVLSVPAWNAEIRHALAMINLDLAERLRDGDSLQFGICYGRKVEFEYEVTTTSDSATRAISNSLVQSLVGPEKGSALLISSESTGKNDTVRGVIKVSMNRYNAWLAEVSARGRAENIASR
jgi:hypothetical protein